MMSFAFSARSLTTSPRLRIKSPFLASNCWTRCTLRILPFLKRCQHFLWREARSLHSPLQLSAGVVQQLVEGVLVGVHAPRHLRDGHPLQYHRHHRLPLSDSQLFVDHPVQLSQHHVLVRQLSGVSWVSAGPRSAASRRSNRSCKDTSRHRLRLSSVRATFMAIFCAQVVKRLSPLKESRLPVILISASWAKSPTSASTPPP